MSLDQWKILIGLCRLEKTSTSVSWYHMDHMIWSDGEWRYASDNTPLQGPLVDEITNWKRGKESGSDEKSCVKFKHKREWIIQIIFI